MNAIGPVLSSALKVYTMIDTAQYNKKLFQQLRLLVEICTGIVEDAKKRGVVPDSKVLQLFSERINDTAEFVEKYKEKSGLMRILCSSGMKEEFRALSAGLSEVSTHLSAVLQVNMSTIRTIDSIQVEDEFEKELEQETRQIRKNIEIKSTDSEDIRILKRNQAEVFQRIEDSARQNTQYRFSFNIKVPEGVKEIYSPELVYENQIGSGKFGFVYKGKYSGKDVAIKVVKNAIIDDIEKLFREAHNLNRSKGPNVMEIYGVCIEPGFECIVMELLPNGSLEDYIQQSNEIISGSRKLDIASGIIQGIETIHLSGRTHRGISPSKILFTSDFVPKISNFDEVNSITGTIAPSAMNNANSLYTHPNVIVNPYFSQQTIDLYSFGCIVYYMFTKFSPTRNISKIMKHFIHKNKQQKNMRTGIRAKVDLIRSKLQDDRIEINVSEIEGVVTNLDNIHEGICDIIYKCLINNNEPKLSSSICRELMQIRQDYHIHYQMGIDNEFLNLLPEALDSYKYACDLGYGRAFFRYGYILMKNDLPTYNPQIALEYFIKATENKSSDAPRAFYNLGIMHEGGMGVPVDTQQALSFYKEALRLGYSDANIRLRAIESSSSK